MAEFVADTVQVHVARKNAINDEYEFLVIKRSPESKIYPSLWQVITGWIEPSETALQTAMRELMEETGLVPSRTWTIPYVATFFNARRDIVQAAPVFGVLVDQHLGVKLSGEHSDYNWLNLKSCLNLLELPTHCEGTRCFNDYILKSKDYTRFEIEL